MVEAGSVVHELNAAQLDGYRCLDCIQGGGRISFIQRHLRLNRSQPKRLHLSVQDTIVLTNFANSTGDAVFDDTLKTALGYDSVSAFIEMFRTMLGTTPQTYFRGRQEPGHE
jgi:hypothetical protein